MPDDKPLSFSERRRLLHESGVKPANGKSLLAPVPTPQPTPKFDADLIPNIADSRSDTDRVIDDTLSNISVLDAYRKWVGKEMDEKTLNRRESIMVSCPMPDHRDKHPSAFMNADSRTWFCGTCQVGGDIYDMAARYHQFPVPGHQEGATFHRLREAMAADFGTHIKRVANHEEIVWKEEPVAGESTGQQKPTPQVQTAPKPIQAPIPPQIKSLHEMQGDNLATVTDIPVVPEDYEPEIEVINYPSLNWREIAPEGTFLYEYTKACSKDDSPEEYHFWNAMLALGHVAGRKVYLGDRKPVMGNLLLCMLGGTGIGKSKSRGYLNKVLSKVLPFETIGERASGVKVIPVPGSGEYLIKTFVHSYTDPSAAKGVPPVISAVNGIVDFDEFAALLARANRQGSTLKSTIMALADANPVVAIGSMTHGEFRAVDPFCSITASTQPKAIRTLVTKADAGSGFINRWLFVSGIAKEKQVFSEDNIDLSRAIDELTKLKGWCGSERRIGIEDDALPRVISFYKTTIYPKQETDDTDLLARMDLMFKKFMLLLTINNREMKVTEDTLERIKPLFNYLVKCYALIHEEIGMTEAHMVGNDLLDVIRKHQEKHKRGATTREIQRYLHRRKYTPTQIKQMLDNLVALDWVEIIKPAAGSMGRPTVRYRATEAN